MCRADLGGGRTNCPPHWGRETIMFAMPVIHLKTLLHTVIIFAPKKSGAWGGGNKAVFFLHLI